MYELLEDITVSTSEDLLVITPVDKCLKKSFFALNKGDNAVTIKIYGSPTGVQVGDRKNDGATYAQTEVDLHYILVATVSIPASDNHMVDLSDYIWDYFKFTAQASGASTIINYKFQKPYQLS